MDTTQCKINAAAPTLGCEGYGIVVVRATATALGCEGYGIVTVADTVAVAVTGV